MKNNVLKWNLHVLMQMMKEKAENHKIKPLSHVGILLVFTDRVVHIAKEKTLCILEYLEFIIISFSNYLKVHAERMFTESWQKISRSDIQFIKKSAKFASVRSSIHEISKFYE